jgi:hypothetical protein
LGGELDIKQRNDFLIVFDSPLNNQRERRVGIRSRVDTTFM